MIILFNYVKNLRHPPKLDPVTKIWGGPGYRLRVIPTDGQPRGIIWHSTEGNLYESFHSACSYIIDAEVSAHYYIGRESYEVERILDPGYYIAYHAGYSKWGTEEDLNRGYIGIELVHTQREGVYPKVQLQNLVDLSRLLVKNYHIPKSNIALHRWVATHPVGRKYDPSDMTDLEAHTLIDLVFAKV